MKKTSEYRKEMLREMQQLRAGNSTVNQAKAVAQLGNAITQSIIAEAQVLRIQADNKQVKALGDLEILGNQEDTQEAAR
jgi:hypothetical protein